MNVIFIYLVQTVSIPFILSRYFFPPAVSQVSTDGEKIVSSEMSREICWNNMSVPVSALDNQSMWAYWEVWGSMHAPLDDRFTRWGDIILVVYPSLSLSDQPASCSSAPTGWQWDLQGIHQRQVTGDNMGKTGAPVMIFKLKQNWTLLLIIHQFIGVQNIEGMLSDSWRSGMS